MLMLVLGLALGYIGYLQHLGSAPTAFVDLASKVEGGPLSGMDLLGKFSNSATHQG